MHCRLLLLQIDDVVDHVEICVLVKDGLVVVADQHLVPRWMSAAASIMMRGGGLVACIG